MSGFFKMKKDENTPRRAILEFLNKATPKESPATEDLIQTQQVPEPSSQDMTPASDTRNLRSLMKRKLIDEEKMEDTLVKKAAVEADTVEIDSVLGISDIPSHMDSPVINLPKRPNLENRKRVSTAAFKNAIEKDKAHKNTAISDELTSEVSGLSDASIPLSLNSPEVNLPRRQAINKKKRVSTVAFKHAIEKSKSLITKTIGEDDLTTQPNDSSAELSELIDSTIPSSLNSPELNLPHQSDLTSKKRVSSTAFKAAIEKNKNLDSKTIDEISAVHTENSPIATSSLSPKIEQTQPTSTIKDVSGSSTKISSPRKKHQGSANMSQNEDSATSEQTDETRIIPETQSGKRDSVPFKQDHNDEILENQLEKDVSGSSISNNLADSTPLGVSNVDAIQLPTALSTNLSYPTPSNQTDDSNQFLDVQPEKKRGSADASKETNQETKVQESLNIKDTPRLELSSLMDSSIPSSLDSPDVNILQRPKSKSKKRVSTTAFKEVLKRRNQLKAPLTNIETTSTFVEATGPLLGPVASVVEELRSGEGSEPVEPLLIPEMSASKDITSSRNNKSAISAKLSSLTLEKSDGISMSKYSESSERKMVSIPNLSYIEVTKSTPDKSTPLPNQSSPMLSGSLSIDNKRSDHDSPESENAPEVALPEDFFPVASSTQMADKILSEGEGIESNRSVNLSVSDIPSDMDSVENRPALRLHSQGSKKRVSMTDFLTALGKRKAPTNSFNDSPEKELNADETYTITNHKSFSNQSTSASNNKTAPPTTIPTRIENVTLSEFQDSNHQLDEMKHREPVTSPMSKSEFKLAPTSASAPLEFLESGVSVDTGKVTEISASKNRSRKSLKFDSPTPKEISSKFDNSEVENSTSSEEDDLEPNEKELSEKTSEKDLESPVLGLSPTMKNSTVVAGGMFFNEPPLPISPIGIDTKDIPSTVQATPNQSAKKRPVAQSPMYMSVMQKVLAQKTKEDKPEDPLPQSIKISEDESQQSISQLTDVKDRSENPILETIEAREDLMKQSILASAVAPGTGTNVLEHTSPEKAAGTSAFVGNSASPIRPPEISDDEWEDAEDSDAKSAKSIVLSKMKKSVSMKSFSFKGSSSSNRTKGKSLASTHEDGIPLAIRIAQETIVDRSRNFVPLEQRLRADPIFQEKVRCQREKMAAEKAVQYSSQVSKKKPRVLKSGPEDNVASASINKANFRFYSQPMKVSKDALDSVHSIVGQWLEFTLDQMGTYCANKCIESLDTWEDCYKMLKSQGIVTNYWEYSGLCHELLTQDECSLLLPSGFPSGHYESKRAAKRK